MVQSACRNHLGKYEKEYPYDNNGNLTKDLNKNITSIQDNVLNLPNVVSFSDGSTITYTYASDGTKLRTVHKIGSTTTTTDYCGNVIYENGVAKTLLTEAGYITLDAPQYHYYLQDHQGNNRVVINQSGAPEETNHYYPFGGVFASSQNVQPYKYNGKELDTKKGLNWYDYGARMYDAALGRFTTVDPLAEEYYSVSPYVYCKNNPINRIDPDGRSSHYNWEKKRYENEKGDEVSWNSVQEEYGIGTENKPDDPPTSSDVDAVTGAAPKAIVFSKEKIIKLQKGDIVAVPIPQSALLIEIAKDFLTSPGAMLFSIPLLLQGDDSPEYVKEATNSSKNEKHGDSGRSIDKRKGQIDDLEDALQRNISRKDKQRIKSKIKNIRENGQQNRKGEEHSRQNKR